MKKILSMLAVVAVAASLLAGCVTTSPKAATVPLQAVEQTYKVDIINKTTNFAIAIMCIVPLPGTEKSECLMDPFAVYPEQVSEEYGYMAPNKVTIHLKNGDYLFLIISVDLRTNEQTRTQGQFTVANGDGELIFSERGMRVNGGSLDA